jgi:hydroxymethylbilane synthase
MVAREDGRTLSTLRSGAVIGTSSIRRKAQLRAMRSDISVVDLHGNVDTRLLKVERENLDGIVIAAAGLERLGESGRVSQYFSPREMIPAPCQGAIAVEIREGDEYAREVLSGIDDGRVRAETTCERSFARELGVDCDVPAGATATVGGGTVTLHAIILSSDGGRIVRGSAASELGDAEGLGARLARQLLRDGGDELIRGVRGS